MILVDTGPFVALFDPADPAHGRCRRALRSLGGPLRTTVPVLTEAFHALSPESLGSDRLREFVTRGGLGIWHLDEEALARAFELMERYADQAMDLSGASLIVAAERLRTRTIFTLDRSDFAAYRIRAGHRGQSVEIVP